MGRIKKNVWYLALAAAALAIFSFCVLCFFVPAQKSVAVGTETYGCVWENGDVTQESYSSALAVLQAKRDTIALSRAGISGTVSVSAEYCNIFDVLSGGSLAELLSLNASSLNRLERAALWSAFGDWIYYCDETFAFDGNAVSRTDRKSAKTVALVLGEFPAGYLADTGAQTLVLFQDADLTPSDFLGTAIQRVIANAPYKVEGAVYYCGAGVRLVAALPNAETLTLLSADVYSEGALTACKNLRELTLSKLKVDYLGTLFLGKSGTFEIPPSLKKVTIAGGQISAHTFYGFTFLEEIDASALPQGSIEADAFAGCTSLLLLKTREEVAMPEAFDCTRDGELYVYTRS